MRYEFDKMSIQDIQELACRYGIVGSKYMISYDTNTVKFVMAIMFNKAV